MEERLEALRKLDELNQICSECNILKNRTDKNFSEVERYCLKKCELSSQFKEIGVILNKSTRERVDLGDGEEKVRKTRKQMTEKKFMFSWSDKHNAKLIEMYKEGKKAKDIAIYFYNNVSQDITRDAVRSKIYNYKKGGIL